MFKEIHYIIIKFYGGIKLEYSSKRKENDVQFLRLLLCVYFSDKWWSVPNHFVNKSPLATLKQAISQFHFYLSILK